MSPDLRTGLDSFAEQFRAQTRLAGPPVHEHGVHFCLALGFQATYDLPLGAIIFERQLGRQRTDIWIAPFDLAVEVKYQRPIPSGRNLPLTQHYGSLLADFSKVAAVSARQRLIVFVSDRSGTTYMRNSGRGVLPLELGGRETVTWASIQRLPQTAVGSAQTHGPWVEHLAELIWHASEDPWQLLAWRVTPTLACRAG